MDTRTIHHILQTYWGYTSFRSLQEDIIQSVLAGNDTLGLMPTGGGKSITFQVPALLLNGICVVVTPLISLMKDQVDNLKAKGIKATTIHTGMTRDEIATQLENCIFGNYKFLYISPERLNSALFKTKLRAMQVNLLAIDESHCISQWGYDFRPAYLNIASIREQLPDVPVLALTATATPDVVQDIQEKLLFKRKNVFQKSFARNNLSYVVRYTEDKQTTLLHLLNRIPGTAIVYVRSRKRTHEIATSLQQANIAAHYFHAGLKRNEKDRRQNEWKNNTCRVMVATNAFGMGIDKPDVRLVVHMDMPGSLEEYFQEAGRAGRDEQKAYAVALQGPTEKTKLTKRITDEYPPKAFVLRVYESLGSFFQIAAGFGLYMTYDFEITHFCAVYKLPINPTYHALRILELAGYIEYVEDPDNASRILFLVSREDLYHLLQNDRQTDQIIQSILRTYTGLFADYAYIHEELIAARAQTTVQQVYERLVALSKCKIINYIPRKKVPQITFVRPREETHYVVLPRFAYEDRKKRGEERVLKVIEYIQNQNTCRTRLLLHYFGEKQAATCQICDVCLQKTDAGLTQWEFNSVREALIALLAEGGSDLREVAERLPLDRDKNIRAIRFLVAHDTRFRLEMNQLVFCPTPR